MAHLPADLLAYSPAALEGDPARQGACGHATRLQQQQRPRIEQDRRYARRLAGTWWGDHDRATGTVNGGADLVEVVVDG